MSEEKILGRWRWHVKVPKIGPNWPDRSGDLFWCFVRRPRARRRKRQPPSLAALVLFLCHNQPIKRRRQSFVRRIRSRNISSRSNPLLRLLRDPPILSVRRVPEGHRVIAAEILLRHLPRMKQPFRNHIRPVYAPRPQSMHHHIIRMQTQKQVRIDRVIQYSLALLSVQPRQKISPSHSVCAHGFGRALEPHRSADVCRPWLVVLSAHVVRHTIQHWMERRTVQTLVVIEHNQLPVRLHLVSLSFEHAQFLHAPGRELLRQIRYMLRERPHFHPKIQKDVPVPHFGGHTAQRVIFLSEFRLFHVRRRQQPPVQPVGPCMIRALDPPRESALTLFADLRSAMPANVVKRAHSPVTAPGHNHTLTRHVRHKVVSGLLNLLAPPRTHPHPEEEALHLSSKHFKVRVISCFQRLHQHRRSLPLHHAVRFLPPTSFPSLKAIYSGLVASPPAVTSAIPPIPHWLPDSLAPLLNSEPTSAHISLFFSPMLSSSLGARLSVRKSGDPMRIAVRGATRPRSPHSSYFPEKEPTNVRQQGHPRRPSRPRSGNALHHRRPGCRQLFRRHRRILQRPQRRASEAHRMAQNRCMGQASRNRSAVSKEGLSHFCRRSHPVPRMAGQGGPKAHQLRNRCQQFPYARWAR